MNIDLIDVDYDCCKPDAAIRRAGDLLVSSGLAIAQYTTEMVELYREYGSYIAVTDEVIIAHAKPDFGALGTGFSIVRLSDGINFGGSDSTSVKFVVAVVGLNDFEHLEMRNKVSDVFSTNAGELFGAQGKEDILRILNKQ